METNIEYILKVIKRISTEGIKYLSAKQEVVDDIFEHMDEMHRDTVWQEKCRSWWKDGKIENRIYIWPGSVRVLRNATVPTDEITGHPLLENDSGTTIRRL